MRVEHTQILRWRGRWVIPLGAVCAACVALFAHATSEIYSPPPFGHYQPILDRMPFGVLPPNFNAVTADAATIKNEEQVKAEQQKLAKNINMSAVNVTPDGGTAIGFTDLSGKTPVNYYLLVGDTSDGWKVLSADFDEETATIEKEGVTVTLKLGQGLVDPAAPAAAPAGKPALSHIRPPLLAPRPALVPPVAAAAEARPAALRALGINGSTLRGVTAKDKTSDPASDSRSYAERLRERATQQTQAQLAAEEKMREQFEKLARETATREIRRREEEAAQAAQAQQQEEPVQEEAPPQEPLPQPAE